MASKPRIAILTLCIGADYARAMEPGLASKRAYAAKHGYAFHCCGEEVWDRSRPIPWSKFNVLLKYLDEYEYLFWSDADAVILNQDLRLETHVLPLLPADKDLLWTLDACENHNNGHMLLRGRSAWLRDFLTRCTAQNQFLYHIWWDNAAMVYLFQTNAADAAKIQTCKKHWLFNAYAFGKTNSARDSERLYQPGDFLLHFAGVYDTWTLYRMMQYALRQANRGAALDAGRLDAWRAAPLPSRAAAEAAVLADTAFD